MPRRRLCQREKDGNSRTVADFAGDREVWNGGEVEKDWFEADAAVFMDKLPS